MQWECVQMIDCGYRWYFYSLCEWRTALEGLQNFDANTAVSRRGLIPILMDRNSLFR